METAAAVAANFGPRRVMSAPAVEPTPGQTFTAIANASPQAEGQLELRTGDVITFHSAVGAGWWEVSLVSLGASVAGGRGRRTVTVGDFGTIPRRTVVPDADDDNADLDVHL